MPAYAIQRVEPQDNRFLALSSRIGEELDACTEIDGVGKNKLKRFLLEKGVQSITELDYSLRQAYKEYLEYNQHIKQKERYLLPGEAILHPGADTDAGRTDAMPVAAGKRDFVHPLPSGSGSCDGI